jgi:glycoprotein-N-acetylgalactosamine 3-beta-galactosyltransferase
VAVSNVTDEDVGAWAVAHEGLESYFNMWQKVRALWRHVYEGWGRRYRYFFLGGDDVYLVRH